VLHRFALAELPATPWKNGGGSTREIACCPPGAGLHSFDWRVSIATIDRSGPFSVFAGVDRCIVLLAGDGVALDAPQAGWQHRLDSPLQPFTFSGDDAVDCTLLGGTSTDFNVMTRRGTLCADVQALHAPASLPATPQGLLLAVRGTWQVHSSARLCRCQGAGRGARPVVACHAPRVAHPAPKRRCAAAVGSTD
jgi:environmental stress-induced protein Ves